MARESKYYRETVVQAAGRAIESHWIATNAATVSAPKRGDR
jgi:hypothetical protein